jgi:hypothetical protein
MTSVSTVFTRVQQSESARYRRNKWISRVAPVEEDAEDRALGGTSKRKKQTMKKLMIVAVAAAMAGVAFADAQVYDYKFSLKSTTCKEGKVGKNTYFEQMGIAERGEEIAYRTSASVVLLGVTWGCNCEDALFQNGWNMRTLSNGQNVWDGGIFWWQKGDFFGGSYDASVITWDMINRIGKKGTDVELAFTLDDSNGRGEAEIKAAGLGTIKDIGLSAGTDCEGSYIKSAKGSAAGYIAPGQGGCYYCDDVVCDVYDFCDCMGLSDAGKTVAFGNWTMKYNSSASKKLRTTAKISSSYSGFPKQLKEVLVNAGE